MADGPDHRDVEKATRAKTFAVHGEGQRAHRFSRTAELIKDFALIADLLGPAMGCFLFQLPPSFKYSPARLKRITDQLDPRHRNVVEFRHKSWWNAKVYAAFRARGIIFCSCSGPRLPDELVTTASDLYIRFHGRKRWYRHDYTQDELRVWAQRISPRLGLLQQ